MTIRIPPVPTEAPQVGTIPERLPRQVGLARYLSSRGARVVKVYNVIGPDDLFEQMVHQEVHRLRTGVYEGHLPLQRATRDFVTRCIAPLPEVDPEGEEGEFPPDPVDVEF